MAIEEGTRILTVGVGTFLVSLFAFLWIFLYLIGRLIRKPIFGLVGFTMLVIVTLVMALIPRRRINPDGTLEDIGREPVYSQYYHGVRGVLAVMVIGIVTALSFLCTELWTVRRAKAVDSYL